MERARDFKHKEPGTYEVEERRVGLGKVGLDLGEIVIFFSSYVITEFGQSNYSTSNN